MAALVELPGYCIDQPGRAYNLHLRPFGIDQPAKRRQVPNLLGIGKLVGLVLTVDLEEIVANRAFALNMCCHLRLGRVQVRHYAHAGEAHEGNAAVQYDPARGRILTEIELTGIGPVAGVAPQPEEDNSVPDVRLHEQSRGNIGDCTDGYDIERVVEGRGQSPFDQIISSIAPDGRPSCGQPFGRTSLDKGFSRYTEVRQPRQKSMDLFVTLLHTVGRSRGAGVVKRGSVQGFDSNAFRREERVYDSELIIDLIESVRVQHYPHWARWRPETVQEKRRVKWREVHFEACLGETADVSNRV